MSTVLVGVMLWVFMIPFLPLVIVTAPVYLLNSSDTGVIGTTFSPDGTHMLATFREDRYTTIFRTRVNGEDVEAITSGEFFDFDPVYSPDGSLIAFCRRSRKRVSHLHVMNADDSNVRQLTDGRREDFTPQFSPDGTRIVFPSYMLRKQADLFVLNLETGVERRLTDGTSSHDVSPVFLPDGKTILFSRARWYGHNSPIASSDWHDYGLYAIPVSGGEVKQLGDVETYRQSTLRVATSPDRRLLIYDGHYVDMDSASFESLAEKEVQYLELQSFPSALKNARVYDVSVDMDFALALTTEKGEVWDDVLFIVDLASNRPREIARSVRAHSITSAQFSPDGQHIVYHESMSSSYGKRHEALWIVTLNGEVRRLDTLFPNTPEWTKVNEIED